jgi:trans-aconitate methyltransferase
MTPFWQLYSGLDREGPGTADDVLWALDRAGVPDRAAICDAGAGSGADTLTLAQARPRGTIVAVEKSEHLVDRANQRLKDHPNAQAMQGDMANLPGSYDFIWCAGALYFLGVTEGLSLWRKALPSGARVAFSEPCYLSTPPR